MRLTGILYILAPLGPSAYAQVPPIGPQCGARVCEEATIYETALDSVMKRPHSETAGAPRVLTALYLAPFDALQDHHPVVGRFDPGDFEIIHRYWREAQLVDSAEVVAKDGHTLLQGGPLYIAAPIDWTGEDAVRLQLAEYPHDLRWGAQLYVMLRRGPHGWHVTEIAVGAIN